MAMISTITFKEYLQNRLVTFILMATASTETLQFAAPVRRPRKDFPKNQGFRQDMQNRRDVLRSGKAKKILSSAKQSQ